jgi:hypothetical protein
VEKSIERQALKKLERSPLEMKKVASMLVFLRQQFRRPKHEKRLS